MFCSPSSAADLDRLMFSLSKKQVFELVETLKEKGVERDICSSGWVCTNIIDIKSKLGLCHPRGQKI